MCNKSLISIVIIVFQTRNREPIDRIEIELEHERGTSQKSTASFELELYRTHKVHVPTRRNQNQFDSQGTEA